MDIEDYSNYAVQYYDRRIPDLLEKYLDSKKYFSIFDCGCGDGNLLYSLKGKGYFIGKNVFASDLSKRRLDFVRGIDKKIVAFIDDAESMSKVRSDSIDFLFQRKF